MLTKVLGATVLVLALIFPYIPIRWPFSFSFYAPPTNTRKRLFVQMTGLIILAGISIAFLSFGRGWFTAESHPGIYQWISSRFQRFAEYSFPLFLTAVFFLVYHIAAIAVVFEEGLVTRLVRKVQAFFQKKRNKAVDKNNTFHFSEKLMPAPEDPLPSNRLIITDKEVINVKNSEKQINSADKEGTESQDQNGIRRLISNLLFIGKNGKQVSRPQTIHIARQIKCFLLILKLICLVWFLILLIPGVFQFDVQSSVIYTHIDLSVGFSYLFVAVLFPVMTFFSYFLLAGEGEKPEETQYEETSSYGRIIDLELIQKNLMQIYGKDYDVKSLFSGDLSSDQGDHTFINAYDIPFLEKLAEYIKTENLKLDQNYLFGAKCLLDRKNVLYDASFHSAAAVYIFSVLSLRLMQGERIVVLCQDKAQIEKCSRELEEGLSDLMPAHTRLWRMAQGAEVSDQAEEDILFLMPEDFRNNILFSRAKRFFSQVTVILVPKADSMVSSNNYCCQIMAERLSNASSKTLQYLFLSDRNMQNLDNALTEYFQLPEKPVIVKSEYTFGDSYFYLWKSKKNRTLVLDHSARTMALEEGIYGLSRKFGVKETNLITENALAKANRGKSNIPESTNKKLKFEIVTDASYNLPGVIYAHARGNDKIASIVHIISGQYLLRDYFYANAARYFIEQPLMERSIVEHAEPVKIEMLRLLCQLLEGIPLEDFSRKIIDMGFSLDKRDPISTETVSDMVSFCVKAATGKELDSHRGSFEIVKRKDAFCTRQYIRLLENIDLFSPLLEETKLIRVRFTSSKRKDAVINRFKRMMDQCYLEGQNLVYQQQNYEIKHIDHEKGIIEVDDSASVHGLPQEYVQLRTYSVKSMEFADYCRDPKMGAGNNRLMTHSMQKAFLGERLAASSMVMIRSDLIRSIESDTYGYYIIEDRGKGLSVSGKPIPIVYLDDTAKRHLHREVNKGLYLRIELTRSRDDRLSMTLAVLLQEMMKTLFPDSFPCLSVCPILERPDLIYENNDSKSALIAHLYPRLEGWGNVVPNSIELLILDDCQGGTGALELLFDAEGTYLQNVLWMLSDYLEWQQESDTEPYYYFGASDPPDIYDINALIPILQTFSQNYIREHDINTQFQADNSCALCGKKLDISHLWNNKLMICEACSSSYRPNLQEANEICRYIKLYIESTFSVHLPEIKVIFDKDFCVNGISAINSKEKSIVLSEALPLLATHREIVTKTVRLWQMFNLTEWGELVFEGQPLYVANQYMQSIKQFQYAHFLHRKYLLSKNDEERGYQSLFYALQSEGHTNSFAFLLQRNQRSRKQVGTDFYRHSSTRAQGNEKVKYYYRSRLLDSEKAFYDDLLKAFVEQVESLSVSHYHATIETVKSVITSIEKDHPELFWIDSGYSIEKTSDDQAVSVKLQYTLSRGERERAQTQIDEAIQPFFEGITDPALSDYEVALHLYEKIIEYLDYDTIALERERKIETKGKRSGEFDSLRNIYGALVDHRAVCAGYAKAYQYLLQKAGIEALYVNGECYLGARHGWNIVYLEGAYYHIDVTFGDFSDTDPFKGKPGLSYAFFGLTEETILKTRSIIKNPPIPSCTQESCNYYVRNELFFTRYDHGIIIDRLVRELSNPKKNQVEMRFSNPVLLKRAEKQLCEQGGFFEAARTAGRRIDLLSYGTKREINVLRIEWEDKR